MLQVVEAVIECSCDVIYNEAFQQELVLIVKECLIEEWAKGDWSTVSVLCNGVGCVVRVCACVGISASVTSC